MSRSCCHANIEQIRINHIRCKLFVPQSQQMDQFTFLSGRTMRINERQFRDSYILQTQTGLHSHWTFLTLAIHLVSRWRMASGKGTSQWSPNFRKPWLATLSLPLIKINCIVNTIAMHMHTHTLGCWPLALSTKNFWGV
jgi:hypothetical protein